HDLRRADDGARRVLERRDRQRDEDSFAIRPQTLSLEMVDPFTGLQARNNSILFTDSIGGNDKRNMLPDRLGSRVAENPFRALIPALNNAVKRLADDRIVGRFDD